MIDNSPTKWYKIPNYLYTNILILCILGDDSGQSYLHVEN